MVTIHPGLVLGPSLQISVVDVRDVARAHITAGFTPEAHGRYITSSETITMLQIGRILRSSFGFSLSFPTFEAPKFMIKLAAPVAGLTRKFVDLNVGWPVAFDSSRTTEELGIEFRPAEESVVEHFQQMIDDGLVPGRG